MSAVPSTLEALVALFRSALPGVQVEYGPPARDIAGDVVLVGFTPELSRVDAVSSVVGLRARDEQFEVACTARTWSGNADVAAQTRRTYALLDQVEDALRSDMTLGRSVFQARLAGHAYLPGRTEQGQLVVDVVFRVEVRAFRS